MSSATELGKILGTALSSANKYKDDFIETDEVTDLEQYGIESLNLTGSWYIYQYTLSGSGLILDHPIYGIIGTSTLTLGRGYLSGATKQFWLDFPIVFGATLYASGTL